MKPGIWYLKGIIDYWIIDYVSDALLYTVEMSRLDTHTRTYTKVDHF